MAARLVAAAAILIDDGIAVPHEIAGDLGARARRGARRRCARSGSAPICRKGCVRATPETARAGRAINIGRQTRPRRAPEPSDRARRRICAWPMSCRHPRCSSIAMPATPARACLPPAFSLSPSPLVRARVRARSSAGEHYVDIVGVTGSIPVAPTSLFNKIERKPRNPSWSRYPQGTPRPELVAERCDHTGYLCRRAEAGSRLGCATRQARARSFAAD